MCVSLAVCWCRVPCSVLLWCPLQCVSVVFVGCVCAAVIMCGGVSQCVMSCTLCRTSLPHIFVALVCRTSSCIFCCSTTACNTACSATCDTTCSVCFAARTPLPSLPPPSVYTLSHTPHTQTPTRRTQQVDGSLEAEKGMGISNKDLHFEIQTALHPPSARVRHLPPLSPHAIHSEAQLKHDVRLSASQLRRSCICLRLSASVCVCFSLSLAHAPWIYLGVVLHLSISVLMCIYLAVVLRPSLVFLCSRPLVSISLLCLSRSCAESISLARSLFLSASLSFPLLPSRILPLSLSLFLALSLSLTHSFTLTTHLTHIYSLTPSHALPTTPQTRLATLEIPLRNNS